MTGRIFIMFKILFLRVVEYLAGKTKFVIFGSNHNRHSYK